MKALRHARIDLLLGGKIIAAGHDVSLARLVHLDHDEGAGRLDLREQALGFTDSSLKRNDLVSLSKKKFLEFFLIGFASLLFPRQCIEALAFLFLRRENRGEGDARPAGVTPTP